MLYTDSDIFLIFLCTSVLYKIAIEKELIYEHALLEREEFKATEFGVNISNKPHGHSVSLYLFHVLCTFHNDHIHDVVGVLLYLRWKSFWCSELPRGWCMHTIGAKYVSIMRCGHSLDLLCKHRSEQHRMRTRCIANATQRKCENFKIEMRVHWCVLHCHRHASH